MSEDLKKIIILEDKLNSYLVKGIDTSDIECEKIVLKISELLNSLSNDELLYLLINGDSIHQVIDITNYFKKYEINKKTIELDNSYKEEFKKLNYFVERVRLSSICEEEYMYICNKCEVDKISEYLLSNMTNETIMELAGESDDWNYKLFLFANLKK